MGNISASELISVVAAYWYLWLAATLLGLFILFLSTLKDGPQRWYETVGIAVGFLLVIFGSSATVVSVCIVVDKLFSLAMERLGLFT